MIDRRTFLLCLTAAIPRFAGAQSAPKMLRIGIVTSGFKSAEMVGPNPPNASVAALLRGLRELGYEYGRDFVTEPRGGDGRTEHYAALATELARLPVDVIVAGGPTLGGAMQATSTIPIVLVGGALDPVRDGFVRSLGKPGGNVTGISIQQVDTTAKRLELLKELTTASPVATLWEQTSRTSWQAVRTAAEARGWELVSLEVSKGADIAAAFRTATAVKAGALLVVGGGRIFGSRQQVVDLAAAHRLPAMYSLRGFVEAGGLMSYGANLEEGWRRAATFVDRIAKGARPADMAIEQPTSFQLVINQKTARTLGIAVPQSLLVRADEIIR